MQDFRQDQRKIAAHPAVPAVFSRTCVEARFRRACEYTHEIAVAMAFHAVPVKGLHLLGCKAVGAHKFHGFLPRIFMPLYVPLPMSIFTNLE